MRRRASGALGARVGQTQEQSADVWPPPGSDTEPDRQPTSRPAPDADTPEPVRDDTTPPRVFISYRSADTGHITEDLAQRLRADLGSRNVFRDKDDLIGGQHWKTALERAMTASDAALFLIGERWPARREDGSARIGDADDPVRAEVRQALTPATHTTAIPLMVGDAIRPDGLPTDVQPLFEDTNTGGPHRIVGSVDDFARDETKPYQEVLVAIWASLIDRLPGRVLVIAERTAMVDLDALVKTMQHERLIDAHELSRFAAGAYIVSPRRLRKKSQQWDDVIVLVDDEPSDRLRWILEALDEHPRFRRIAAVGTGAGLIAGILAASGHGSVVSAAASAPAELLSTLPKQTVFGHVSGWWAGASTIAKSAVVAGGLVAGAGGTAAVVNVVDGGSDPIEFPAAIELTVTTDDERSYPFGEPPDARIILSEAQPGGISNQLPNDIGIEFVTRGVTIDFAGIGEFELGDVVLPIAMPGDFVDLQGTRTMRVAAAEIDIAPTIAEFPNSGFCYEIQDPSNVVGGWVYTGESGALSVEFATRIEDGDVIDGNVFATISGPTRRLLTQELPDDFDLSRCAESQTGSDWWTQPEPVG